MLEIVRVLTQSEQQFIIDELSSLYNYLENDVSTYAKGRQRFWLKEMSNLQAKEKHQYSQAVPPSLKLWDSITDMCSPYIVPELGLVSKGINGIDWHGDAAYADWKAITINLGKCKWYYCHSYSGYKWEREPKGPHQRGKYKPLTSKDYLELDLIGGEVLLFNCKNLHKAEPLTQERVSISLWSKKL